MIEEKEQKKFERAYEIDCREFTEKKNNLTYLSWAHAWKIMKIVYPEATYKVFKNEKNMPYFEDETGAVCYTEVTANGETHEMWLPVMDGANKAMKKKPYTYQVREWKNNMPTGNMIDKYVEAYDIFDINKTVMRCLTKNLAMFGIGLYLYAGEDLPEEIASNQIFTSEAEKKKAKEDAIKIIDNYESAEGLSIFIKNHKNAWLKSVGKDIFEEIAIYAGERKKIIVLGNIISKIGSLSLEEAEKYFAENINVWENSFNKEQINMINEAITNKKGDK